MRIALAVSILSILANSVIATFLENHTNQQLELQEFEYAEDNYPRLKEPLILNGIIRTVLVNHKQVLSFKVFCNGKFIGQVNSLSNCPQIIFTPDDKGNVIIKRIEDKSTIER